ncbi:MAG TPA: glycosyltransferase family 39 protein [Gemmatimonadaceae bacterium]|nr:glycosyltransferase family 39 protein [Gemmatimonadaceae bacterium]
MTSNISSHATPLSGRVSIYGMRLLGAGLLLLITVPVYRIAANGDSDRIAHDVADSADLSRSLFFLGTLIIVTIGILASRVADPGSVDKLCSRLGARLASLPTRWVATVLALFTGLATLTFSNVFLQGKPNLIDAMVQLANARYVAAGHLSGPVNQFSEFWHLPNSVASPNGWVSQYPPGFVVLLGIGLRLGIPQLVGPFLAGLTVFFTLLAAERLFPDDKAVARLGALMLAFSPFLIGLAGAFMNHVGASAFISAAVYCALRSRDEDSVVWAALSGASVGAVFSIRPLTALVATLLVAIIWVAKPVADPRERIRSLLKLPLGAVVGIAPFLAALGAYNQYFFGSPFRFGYAALVGPLVAPGFHRDPSGHIYGPLQALGYTASDLTTLSLYLLETPLPAVGIVAAFLTCARQFPAGVRIVLAWALLPVVANALYWHHGIFMGPRMLNEWAPAWALLTAIAAVGLVRLIPRGLAFGDYSPRSALAISFLLAWAVGIFYLGPQRLARYGGSWMASARMTIPPVSGASLVFVHGGWTTRIAMRLVAHGLRGDSLEAALAQNATCDVHNFADWYTRDRASRPAAKPPISFDFDSPNKTSKLQIAQGEEIRYVQGAPVSRQCLVEIASDTLGIIETAPLAWQSDLPGLERGGAMIVRDLGPQANGRLIQRYPERIPMLLYRDQKEGAPKLVPYTAGIKSLWPAG